MDDRCNRCGRKCIHMVELSGPRQYCNDPAWGFDCWNHVRKLVLELTGREPQ